MLRKSMFKKLIGVIAVITVLSLLLAACGGSLSAPKNGTYKSEGLLSQTWTFSGSNNITMATAGGLVSTTGTYTIDGNKITITSSLFGTSTTQTNTITEITSDSFFIDGTKFIKQ